MVQLQSHQKTLTVNRTQSPTHIWSPSSISTSSNQIIVTRKSSRERIQPGLCIRYPQEWPELVSYAALPQQLDSPKPVTNGGFDQSESAKHNCRRGSQFHYHDQSLPTGHSSSSNSSLPFSSPEQYQNNSPPTLYEENHTYDICAERAGSEFAEKSNQWVPNLPLSYISNHRAKAPSSPLACSQVRDEFETSDYTNRIGLGTGYSIHSRRHMLQSSTLVNPTSSSLCSFNLDKSLPDLRREESITKNIVCHHRLILNSSPTPHSKSSLSNSRNRSLNLSNGPQIYHSSMIGSYEESILHGRMSTTPSKPVCFVAQIGVIGIGKCKPSLRFPAHVTISFPAVFYRFENTNDSRNLERGIGQSPYVGVIDLEKNNLGLGVKDSLPKKINQNTNSDLGYLENDVDLGNSCTSNRSSESETHRAEKNRRRSLSTNIFPVGGYRIPKVGQIQIIVKNPNLTAIKLFVVPYNLSGMEPGTKTFIRQRSYATGSTVGQQLKSEKYASNTGASGPQILRYLVHLQICSPSSDRFYLYKSIRLVFANRISDVKEKLRNEVSLPEPRFSTYRPYRDPCLNSPVSA